jgi:hypothetical protein
MVQHIGNHQPSYLITLLGTPLRVSNILLSLYVTHPIKLTAAALCSGAR